MTQSRKPWPSLLFGVLAAASLLCGGSPQAAQAQGNSASDRNIKAHVFLDTFGVNVHFGDNRYRDLPAMARALKLIGFSHVRGDCASDAEVSAWKALAAQMAPDFSAGLRADVLVTGYLNAPDNTFARQQTFISQISGWIETIEGPNEINNYGVGHGTHGPYDLSDQTTHFAANSLAWAKALWEWKVRTPALSHVGLLAPCIASGDPKDYAALPDLSSYVSAGNLHFYAGNGRQPSNFGGGNFAAISNWYRAAATPGKPVAVTECGQTTAPLPGQGGCDQATQAKYILNQLFDAAACGVYRAYVYQLMDDTPDGDPTGQGGAESHFGLFDFQWVPKPAARALAVLQGLLQDSKSNFTPTVPAYQVHGVTDAGAAGSSLSLSKSDGTTMIVVWNEPRIWDPATNAPVIPAIDPVTVTFGGPYTYHVFDPCHGPAAIAGGHGTSIHVNLSGSPILVELNRRRSS